MSAHRGADLEGDSQLSSLPQVDDRRERPALMKFEELYEKARNRGFTLSKATKPARPGKRPIRYVLEDNHNLLHFRSLEEVERQAQ